MANNSRMNFKDWVNGRRGRSIATARALGITQPVVSDWVTGKKAIPAEHCKAIEQLSGGLVTCQEMRPNDWQKYWPELAPALVNAEHKATKNVAQDESNVMQAMLTKQRDRALDAVVKNPGDQMQKMILNNRNEALAELAQAPANTAQIATENVAQGVANV